MTAGWGDSIDVARGGFSMHCVRCPRYLRHLYSLSGLWGRGGARPARVCLQSATKTTQGLPQLRRTQPYCLNTTASSRMRRMDAAAVSAALRLG